MAQTPQALSKAVQNWPSSGTIPTYSYKTEDLPMAIAKYRISLKGTDSKLVRAWSLVSGEPSSISPHAQPPGALGPARLQPSKHARAGRYRQGQHPVGLSTFLSILLFVQTLAERCHRF